MELAARLDPHHGMASAQLDPGAGDFRFQPPAIGGAEIDPAEFAHAEGRMAAMARGAAEMRLALQQHDAGDALATQFQRRRDPGRPAADDEDIRFAHDAAPSTASGSARWPRVISARRALQ